MKSTSQELSEENSSPAGTIFKLDMSLWNTDAPGGKKIQNIAKIFKFYILTPRGMGSQSNVRNP